MAIKIPLVEEIRRMKSCSVHGTLACPTYFVLFLSTVHNITYISKADDDNVILLDKRSSEGKITILHFI